MNVFFNLVGKQDQNISSPKGDYIPVISTFHTMMMLFRKSRLFYENTCGRGSNKERLIYDYNYALANHTSMMRCIAPLVPVVGNLFAYCLDEQIPEKRDPIHLLKKTIVEASDEDKLKIAQSLAQTDIASFLETIHKFVTKNEALNEKLGNIFLNLPVSILPQVWERVEKLSYKKKMKLLDLYLAVAKRDLTLFSVKGICRFFGSTTTLAQLAYYNTNFKAPFVSDWYNNLAKEGDASLKLAMAELTELMTDREHLLKHISCFSTDDPEHNFKLAEFVFITRKVEWSFDIYKLYVQNVVDHPFIKSLHATDLEKKMKMALFFVRICTRPPAPPHDTLLGPMEAPIKKDVLEMFFEPLLLRHRITLQDVLAFPAEVKREIFSGFNQQVLLEMVPLCCDADKLLIFEKLLPKLPKDNFYLLDFTSKDEEHNFQIVLRILNKMPNARLQFLWNCLGMLKFSDPEKMRILKINIQRYSAGPIEVRLGALVAIGSDAKNRAERSQMELLLQPALDDVAASRINPLELAGISNQIKSAPKYIKLMLAQSLLRSVHGAQIGIHSDAFTEDDEEHNYNLAKLFITTPNNINDVINATHLAEYFDRFRLSELDQRLELAEMVYDKAKWALAENIGKFWLPPRSDLYEKLPFLMSLMIQPNPSPEELVELVEKYEEFLTTSYQVLCKKWGKEHPSNFLRRIRKRQGYNLPTEDLELLLHWMLNYSSMQLMTLFSHASRVTANLMNETRVSYLPYIEEPNMKWVLPFFDKDELRSAMRSYPELFSFIMQRITKVQKDALFKFGGLYGQFEEWSPTWYLAFIPHRWNALVEAYKKTPSSKNRVELQQKWRAERLALLQLMASSRNDLKKLSKVKPLPLEVVSFITRATVKLEHLEKVVEEFHVLVNTLTDQLEVPEEFLCPIMGVPLQNPMRLKDSEGTCEYEIWVRSKGKSPFNRAPFELKDLIVDEDLKARIDAWRKENPQAWASAQ